jgi:hypothetical protein
MPSLLSIFSTFRLTFDFKKLSMIKIHYFSFTFRQELDIAYATLMQVCQTVIDTHCKTRYKKGCKNKNACKAGPAGCGKCVYCCTGPECDFDPKAQNPNATCGADYTTGPNQLTTRQASDSFTPTSTASPTCGEINESLDLLFDLNF